MWNNDLMRTVASHLVRLMTDEPFAADLCAPNLFSNKFD